MGQKDGTTEKSSPPTKPIAKMWASSVKTVGRRVAQARLCSSSAGSDPVVFVEGVRTPFLASLTDFQHLMPHQLLARTFQGILERTGLAADQVDYLCAGTVQQEVRTSNIAKEAAFTAGCLALEPFHSCQASHSPPRGTPSRWPAS